MTWERRAKMKNIFLRPVLSLILPKNQEKIAIPIPIHVIMKITCPGSKPFELKNRGKKAK